MIFAAQHQPLTSDPLEERVRLWRAQAWCATAQGAAALCLAWLALSAGGGPLEVSLVMLCILGPVSLATPWAVRVAGVLPRRRLLVWSQLVLAISLGLTAVVAPAGGVMALLGSALVLGCCRCLFDVACLDVVHHLVAPERQRGACKDLSARFGRGQMLGVALGLIASMPADPVRGIVVAAGCALIGALASAGHHRDLDLRARGTSPIAESLPDGLLAHVRSRRLWVSTVAGGIGMALAGAQAALLVSWLRDGFHLNGGLALALLGGVLLLAVLSPLAAISVARHRERHLLAGAFFLQATAFICLGATGAGAPAAAIGYGLGLAAVVLLSGVVNRARAIHTAPQLLPAAKLAGGALWTLCVAVGALGGVAVAATIGLAAALPLLAVAAALLAAGSMIWSEKPLGLSRRLASATQGSPEGRPSHPKGERGGRGTPSTTT